MYVLTDNNTVGVHWRIHGGVRGCLAPLIYIEIKILFEEYHFVSTRMSLSHFALVGRH
jgi:hypothetical protein